MSFKSIELQVAIPRTQDAGKLQEQMLKQNQHFQESLAQTQQKQEELKRKRVQTAEDIGEIDLKNQEQKRNNNESAEPHNGGQLDNQTIEHPYLGTKLDYSG